MEAGEERGRARRDRLLEAVLVHSHERGGLARELVVERAARHARGRDDVADGDRLVALSPDRECRPAQQALPRGALDAGAPAAARRGVRGRRRCEPLRPAPPLGVEPEQRSPFTQLGAHLGCAAAVGQPHRQEPEHTADQDRRRQVDLALPAGQGQRAFDPPDQIVAGHEAPRAGGEHFAGEHTGDRGTRDGERGERSQACCFGVPAAVECAPEVADQLVCVTGVDAPEAVLDVREVLVEAGAADTCGADDLLDGEMRVADTVDDLRGRVENTLVGTRPSSASRERLRSTGRVGVRSRCPHHSEQ